ncbi:MAG: DUF4230 domain-containing protein [Acidimicrobiia bacterium]
MTAQIPQAPAKKANTTLMIVGAILLASVLAVGGFVSSAVFNAVDAIPTPSDIAAALAPEPYLEIGPVVVESVQDLAELTTVEMVEYTIVEQGTDEGWLEWARGDSLRLMAVASIGAGVDLSGVGASSFDVSESGVVEVTLPAAEIQYVAVDSEATQVLDREKGIFTKGDPQLETEARRIAETVLVDGALESGILAQAEDNARSVVTNFLLSLGYEGVIVSFEG